MKKLIILTLILGFTQIQLASDKGASKQQLTELADRITDGIRTRKIYRVKDIVQQFIDQGFTNTDIINAKNTAGKTVIQEAETLYNDYKKKVEMWSGKLSKSSEQDEKNRVAELKAILDYLLSLQEKEKKQEMPTPKAEERQQLLQDLDKFYKLVIQLKGKPIREEGEPIKTEINVSDLSDSDLNFMNRFIPKEKFNIKVSLHINPNNEVSLFYKNAFDQLETEISNEIQKRAKKEIIKE